MATDTWLVQGTSVRYTAFETVSNYQAWKTIAFNCWFSDSGPEQFNLKYADVAVGWLIDGTTNTFTEMAYRPMFGHGFVSVFTWPVYASFIVCVGFKPAVHAQGKVVFASVTVTDHDPP